MKNLNEFFANKNKKMLVDGDLLVYKISSAIEQPIDWGNDIWTLSADMSLAKQMWKQSIAFYLQHTQSKDCIIVFSDKENFRKKIDSFYKSHRKKIRKPVIYSAMRDWIKETHICGSYPNLEADDTIGIYATSLYKDNCVLISGDKDFRTIPAWQCCIIDDQIEYVDNKSADYNFCTQVLTGDASDGYKGCQGVGAVKASRILLKPKTLEQMWDAVVQEYLKNGYVVDDVYHQARLARILRANEYNVKTNQPLLWKYNYEKYRNIRQSKKSA